MLGTCFRSLRCKKSKVVSAGIPVIVSYSIECQTKFLCSVVNVGNLLSFKIHINERVETQRRFDLSLMQILDTIVNKIPSMVFRTQNRVRLILVLVTVLRNYLIYGE